jgi:MOSC domain-containing protein YiiM
MGTARILSVSTGRSVPTALTARVGRTAIDKRPLTAGARVTTLGLAGDEQADLDHHGGPDQAVYVYAREDLDWWARRLGRELRDGQFGENLTTSGLEVSGAAIGERWQLGSAVVQVTAARIPCATFQAWMDEPRWVRRFAQAARPGAYLRVLREGWVTPGDPVEVIGRPAVRVTVAEAMAAFYGDVDIMRRLLEVEGRGGKWDAIGQDLFARAGV